MPRGHTTISGYIRKVIQRYARIHNEHITREEAFHIAFILARKFTSYDWVYRVVDATVRNIDLITPTGNLITFEYAHEAVGWYPGTFKSDIYIKIGPDNLPELRRKWSESNFHLHRRKLSEKVDSYSNSILEPRELIKAPCICCGKPVLDAAVREESSPVIHCSDNLCKNVAFFINCRNFPDNITALATYLKTQYNKLSCGEFYANNGRSFLDYSAWDNEIVYSE